MSEILEPKSGLRSSEFWSLQASKLVAVLVAFGLLSQDQGDSLVTAISHAAAVIVLVAGLIWGDARYSSDRTALKQFLADLDPNPQRFDEEPPHDGETVELVPPPPSPAYLGKSPYSVN